MKTKILLAIVFLGNTLLFGQTGGIITGKISSNESKQGISFAKIVLKRNGQVLGRTVTDIDGNYGFSDLGTGVYTLKTNAPGYSGITVLNLLVDSALVNQNMEMELNPDVTAYDVPQNEEPVISIKPEDEEEMVENAVPEFVASEPVSPEISQETTPSAADRTAVTMPSTSQVNIYPNPIYESASIEITADTDIEGGIIKLYDIFGTEVRTFAFSGKTTMFQREGLAAGVYVYQINSANRSIATGKMLLM